MCVPALQLSHLNKFKWFHENHHHLNIFDVVKYLITSVHVCGLIEVETDSIVWVDK